MIPSWWLAGYAAPPEPQQPTPAPERHLHRSIIRAVLKVCEGRDFADRRDAAIIRLFLDTGIRVSEAAGITVPGDLDLDDQVVVVLGKGRRPRAVPFGRKTALALDRYLRLRASHPFTHLPSLWLGLAGAMTSSGLYQVGAARGGRRPAFRDCIRTGSATPSPTPGCWPGVTRVI